MVEGYKDPAIEGEIIMFSCRSGLMNTGPNSATCMGNGEWEPDLREVQCTGGFITTAATITMLGTVYPSVR